MPKGQAQTSPSAVYRPEAPQKALTEEITGIYEAFGLACINALTESDRRTYKALDKESYDYLTGPTRGLTAETLRRFKIFSVTDYTATNNYLKKAYGIDALRRAGLINPDPKKNKTNICFWKHKVITPFIEDKKIVFLQGRRIDGEGKLKYLNAFRPVPLFNAETLKGLKAGEKVYICEGVFDAIMLEQNGLPAVAILGVTNFKSSMVKLFKGLEVVLCLDNDDKGHKATKEIKDIFTAQGQSVKAKPLPDGIKDITEYYQKGE
jgi:DNA primase